jgi:hypothetical protein
MSHRISLRDLQHAADKHRPAGYYDHVMSYGRIEDGVLILEDDAYLDLQKNYSQHRRVPVRQSIRLPGDALSILIKRITGQRPCPKKCRQRIVQMNAWGWWRCWHNRKTISGWLREEARRRGHTILNALDFLKAAWKELRQRKSRIAQIPQTRYNFRRV